MIRGILAGLVNTFAPPVAPAVDGAEPQSRFTRRLVGWIAVAVLLALIVGGAITLIVDLTG